MKDEKRSQDRPSDIRKRSFQYALHAIKPYRYLDEENDSTGRLLAKQCLRAATSGESRANFKHKHGPSQKEARESLYWLGLMSESGLVLGIKLDPLIQETNELIAIITTIIVKSKRVKSLHPKEKKGPH